MKELRVKLVIATEDLDDHDGEHWQELKKTGFWGKRAAGCIFIAKDTGRILLPYRSEHVLEPHTWGSWGGALDGHEMPRDGVTREVVEETGYKGHFELFPMVVFKHESGFKYFNYVAVVDKEFKPKLNWETEKFKWVSYGQWPAPLHNGIKFLLQHSGKEIQELCDQFTPK